MFLHASTQTLVTVRRQQREGGHSTLVEFVDAATGTVVEAIPAQPGSHVLQVDDLFVVASWSRESAILRVGRMETRSVGCSVEVTRDGASVMGDEALLALLPSRLDGGAGRVIQRTRSGFVLRTFDLERHLAEPYPGEMPTRWRLSPDCRYAVVWRTKGSPHWPVLDINRDEVVHRIEGLAYNEPVLAFGPGEAVQVGVSDQLHRLDSIHGQLSAGVRLKDDNSGSYIDSIRVDEDGLLLVTWFGRGELPELVGVETVQQLIRTINRDQAAFGRGLVDAGRYGVVLRFDLATSTVTAAAQFPDWVVDPIVQGDDVIAVLWSEGIVVRSRFQRVTWPTYPPRAPGESLWF